MDLSYTHKIGKNFAIMRSCYPTCCFVAETLARERLGPATIIWLPRANFMKFDAEKLSSISNDFREIGSAMREAQVTFRPFRVGAAKPACAMRSVLVDLKSRQTGDCARSSPQIVLKWIEQEARARLPSNNSLGEIH